MHLLRLAVLATAFAVLISVRSHASEVPDTCPVTKPSDHSFTPPAPYPSVGSFWIGNEKLWTSVTADGIWNGLGHYAPDDSRFRQKLFWWSEYYDWRTENQPELTVTGERLDGPAPHVAADEHANAGWTNDQEHPFMVTGIFIPTLGCWRITGRYKGEELSYVVWVSEECSSNELLASVKPDDPAYADSMNLANTLRDHAFIVKCVLQSKMVHTFEGQTGAAVFKTDHGDFDVLFLPTWQTFDSLEVLERRENGRFLYSFRGIPRPTSPHPINSAHPIYFGKHSNQLFMSSEPELAASIVKSVS